MKFKNFYFWTTDDGLTSIDLKDTNLRISDITDSKATINVNLTLIDYGRDISDFKVKLYLPESLSTCFDTEFIEFDEQYKTFGHHNVFSINKDIKVNLADNCTDDEVLDSQWYWETYRYDLYNDKQSVMIMNHGI